MESQVQGVLQALGLPYALKRCVRKKPFAWLPAGWHFGALSQLTSGSDPLTPPWPDAVITSGRRSAALGLAVKAASGGKTKAIHLTDPRSFRNRFDLIVAMEHDNTPGNNVIRTRFALHRVTPQALQEAAKIWEPRFAHLPRPWIAVLLGGSTNRYTLRADAMKAMIAQLNALQSEGSLLITPSRRTGEENIALLRTALGNSPRAFLHGMQGENPYLAFLALADYLVVTDDSVNMLSEAQFTGKPLYILPLPGQEQTRAPSIRFAESLIAQGIARPLKLPLAEWRYPVVDEMQQVTEAVKRLIV